VRADAFLAATTSRPPPPPPPPPRGALASGGVGGLQGIIEDEVGEALSQAEEGSDALGRSREEDQDAHKEEEEEEEEDSVQPAADARGAGGGRAGGQAGRGAASDALAANNRTFVATDAQVHLRLKLECIEPAAAADAPPASAHAVGGVRPARQGQNARVWRHQDSLKPEQEHSVQQQQQGICAVLDRDQGPEGAAPAAAEGVCMLHVHLVRATNLFAKNQPRPAVAHTRRPSCAEVAGGGGGGGGVGRAAGEESYDVWPTRTAVCLVRLKVLGAKPGEAAAAACNTAVNAQTFDTPDPSFDFICGFQTRCPRKACLDISLWHAEKLLALDAHLIFGKQEQVARRSDPCAAGVGAGAQACRGRESGSAQDGVWPACAGASHDSLAFLRATDIQNFLSKGATSAAYMGSVQVHLRQLLPHVAREVEISCQVLVPTLLSQLISAARVVQAACRQVSLSPRAVPLPRRLHLIP
jgi:hypothetical protein